MAQKRAKVSELKARLSEFLRYVAKGDSVLVLDRNLPVARVTSIAADGLKMSEPEISVKEAIAGLAGGAKKKKTSASLEVLLADRAGR